MYIKRIDSEQASNQVTLYCTRNRYKIDGSDLILVEERTDSNSLFAFDNYQCNSLRTRYSIMNAEGISAAYLYLEFPFACCGAGAVSSPWIANDRVLNKMGVTVAEVARMLIRGVFAVHRVSYLLQVDRAALAENPVNNAHAGNWKSFIDAYDGEVTELYNKHVNVRHGDSVLAGFAFVNPLAVSGGMYRKYSGTYKKGNIK